MLKKDTQPKFLQYGKKFVNAIDGVLYPKIFRPSFDGWKDNKVKCVAKNALKLAAGACWTVGVFTVATIPALGALGVSYATKKAMVAYIDGKVEKGEGKDLNLSLEDEHATNRWRGEISPALKRKLQGLTQEDAHSKKPNSTNANSSNLNPRVIQQRVKDVLCK